MKYYLVKTDIDPDVLSKYAYINVCILNFSDLIYVYSTVLHTSAIRKTLLISNNIEDDVYLSLMAERIYNENDIYYSFSASLYNVVIAKCGFHNLERIVTK